MGTENWLRKELKLFVYNETYLLSNRLKKDLKVHIRKELHYFPFRLSLLMFASNKAQIIENSQTTQKKDVLKTLLNIYKLLKEIARYEESVKTKYKIAKLTPEKLEKIRLLEASTECCFVAYENQKNHQDGNKFLLLDKIQTMLEEYKRKFIIKQNSEMESSFKSFFEQ